MTSINVRQSEKSDVAPEFTFPLSATQTRCWFLDQLRPGDASLNVAVRWELRGAVTPHVVEQALKAILVRHEVLRTRLVSHADGGAQEVLPSVDFILERIDLAHVPVAEQDREIEVIAGEHAARPFDLTKPPLIRVAHLLLADGRALLLIVAHQSVFDGYSIGVMGKEFAACLEASLNGTEPGLPDLPLQYGDYALWQSEYLSSDAVEEDAAFWKQALADADYFELEPDYPRPKVRTTTGDHVYVDLPVAFGDKLEAAARRHDTSPFALGVGVLSSLLSKWTGAEDVLFGTQIAGRDESELEDLIGVFINNLVLRLPVQRDGSLSAQIGAAKSVVQRALLHQNLPFNKLVEVLRPHRDPSRNPLISINFNLQRRTFLENVKTDQFELISRPSSAAGTIYDLNILLIGRPNGWRLTLEYASDLFARETAQRFAEDLVAAFEKAFEAPEARVSDLPNSRRATAVEPSPVPARELRQRGSANVTELPVRPRAAANTVVAPAVSLQKPLGNETEARLAELWAELLGLEPGACTGDFFALGGHSLLAMRMLSRVEQAFGIRPGIALFLANPTLAGFAERIDIELLTKARRLAGHAPEAACEGETWELIELRPSANDAVIVTINHPIFYYMLAGSFQPVATLANLRIPDDASIAAQADLSFDAITADAARLVAAAYPNQNIVMLGLCVNGRLALRIAQHLEEAGVAVKGCVMLDSWAPGAFAGEASGKRFLRTMDLRWKRWSHYLGLRLKGRIGTLDLLRKNGSAEALLRRFGLAPQPAAEERLLGEVTAHLQAKTRDYRFADYAGRALLFKTEASTAEAVERMFGWADILAEDTPVYPVTGWHEDALSNSGMAKVARIIDKRMLSDVGDDTRARRDRRATRETGRGTSAA